MQWNFRSIFHKLPEIKQYLSTLDELPEVICLQETHLTSKYQPTIPSYVIQRKDRPPHRGKGGVIAICIINSLNFSEIITPSPADGLEIIGIKIGHYSIINVYNPPSCFLDINNLEFLSRLNRLVLCGDFNAHHGMWVSSQNYTEGRVLVSLLDNHD